ncbi:MAG: bifunctional DNA primase/polymerase [Chromatiales bacterium]|nr:bifunctional DNA primase/polymerase [Chromatiales bacterium]
MIEVALQYAAHAWPVLPLVPGGKVPVIRGGRGCHDASTNGDQIRDWWSRYPEANVGLATGRRSGVVVLDIDVKDGKPGLRSLSELSPPPTFTVRTASGGLHLYYRMPPGADIGIGAGILPGIDWRGTGGYVVAAGAVTPAGVYAITEGLPLADLPPRLADLLRRGPKRPALAADSRGELVVPEGQRDDALMRMACGLRRFGVGAQAILAALRGLNAALCHPPLPDTDLQRIAVSAAKYPPANRGMA